MTGAAEVRPMTDEEFAGWADGEVESYAAEIAESTGVPIERARERASTQQAGLLPHGRSTLGMHLLRVLDGAGRPAGVLWVGPHPQRDDAGWVYDIAINEDRRGEGLGRAAMLAAEEVCRRQGWVALGLNVFGPNTRARSLYDSLGYAVTNTAMSKPLR